MVFTRKYKRNGKIYLAEVENQRVGGKVRQRFIRYLGPSPSEKDLFPSSNQDLSLDGVKLHGSILALNEMAKLIGLPELLGPYSAPILALAYSHCHDYKGVADMKRWLSTSNTCKILGVEKITLNQLHEALSAIEKMDILSIQKSIFETLKKISGDSCSGVIYDVTNTYLRGSLSELAKKGKDKEGVRGRRLVQIGLGMTSEMRLPIFHQLHPGNTSDSKMFGEGVQLLRRFGIYRGIIVYDRGIHAKSSILDLSNINWKVLGGVPMNKGIKNFISKMDLAKLENYRYRLEQGNSIFYVKTFPYEIGGVLGKLAIILNPQKKYDLKQERLHRLSTALMDNAISAKDSGLKKFITSSGKINTHALKRIERYDGLSFIFTTSKISSENIIKTYFDKDLIERAFKSLKSVLALPPLRHWLDGKITGHLFICYLSLVLLTTFRFLLQKSSKMSLQGVTAERALRELQSVYMIEYSKLSSKTTNTNEDKKIIFQRVITLSNLQKDILFAVSPNLVCSEHF